jgi:thioredoxin-like negative regulator of GroEL
MTISQMVVAHIASLLSLCDDLGEVHAEMDGLFTLVGLDPEAIEDDAGMSYERIEAMLEGAPGLEELLARADKVEKLEAMLRECAHVMHADNDLGGYRRAINELLGEDAPPDDDATRAAAKLEVAKALLELEALEQLVLRCDCHKSVDECRQALANAGGDVDAAFKELFTW